MSKKSRFKKVSTAMYNSLLEEKIINWWLNDSFDGAELMPLDIPADGNCLLHAVSMAMYGHLDTKGELRTELHTFLILLEENDPFYQAWKAYQEIKFRESGFQLSEQQWENEWNDLVQCAYPVVRSTGSYGFLENTHIFALANMLRKTIIVFAPSTDISGIYLPLICSKSGCDKEPIILAYYQSHFATLLCNSKCKLNEAAILPLMDNDKNYLPIPFSDSSYEDATTKKTDEFLRKLNGYLDVFHNFCITGMYLELNDLSTIDVPEEKCTDSMVEIELIQCDYEPTNQGTAVAVVSSDESTKSVNVEASSSDSTDPTNQGTTVADVSSDELIKSVKLEANSSDSTVKAEEMTKEKNYCEICGKFFAKTNNYTRHYRNVHQKHVFEQRKRCKFCIGPNKRLFKYNRNLRNHLHSHPESKGCIEELIKQAEVITIPGEASDCWVVLNKLEESQEHHEQPLQIHDDNGYDDDDHWDNVLNAHMSTFEQHEQSEVINNEQKSVRRAPSKRLIKKRLHVDVGSMLNQTKRQKLLSIEKNQIRKETSKCHAEHEKQRGINDTIPNLYMGNHPKKCLLKGLSMDPVCKLCLGNGNVIKCAGKCCEYFHMECLSKSFPSDYTAILKQKMTENVEPSNDIVSAIVENSDGLQCTICTTSTAVTCFVCSKSDGICLRCCEKNCGKVYHLECLKYWPQHKKKYANHKIKGITCSRHICQTCDSKDIQNTLEPDKKLIKCMLCPGTYHRSSECIPAGSELLSQTQLICARHQTAKNLNRVNTDYCVLCSGNGSLICCEECPHAVHEDCLKIPVGDQFICEECESGRRPLYGEIVWCKYGRSEWWPAITVPTLSIPDQVVASKKEPNQICVFFFGTHNYGWVSQSRIYLYVKEDKEFRAKNETKKLKIALDEAVKWMDQYQGISEKSDKCKNKPPLYKKIKNNRILAKLNSSEYNECKCRPTDPFPCSIENKCHNAIMKFECDPDLCPAKNMCQNQNFRRGQLFSFQVKMTQSKGWGLYAMEDIPAEKFIIEYMGEVIDNEEFDQRFNRAKNDKEDNYYFLKLPDGLYIDAAVYGNEARFINHSCSSNVILEKWTFFSNGQEQSRIGIFSKRRIHQGEELCFDYNWDKKIACRCGLKECRGFI